MKSQKLKAFTLIELLVVIGIIALLLTIIMPALSKAKQIAAASVCLSNNRQLGVSYYTYSNENDGALADGQPALTRDGYNTFTIPVVGTYRAHSFTGEPRDENGAWRNTSIQDKIRGFEVGALWPYLESPDIFNCPIDRRWKKPPADPAVISATNSIGGYRSYSIGAVLSAAGYSMSTGEGDYVILNYSEFSNPGSKIVFLEEQASDGFNQNTWNVFLDHVEWWDPFAIVHNGSSTFAYADGHAARHKWTDKTMIEMSDPLTGYKRGIPDTMDDYNWFKRAYIPGRVR